MFMNLCGEVIQIVKQWKPEKRFQKHDEYRDDLMEFIRKKFEEHQRYIYASKEKHRIKKEADRHFADIGIDEKIGIELKLNLKGESEIDRLDGQIRKFTRQYNCVIVVLCGEVSAETVADVEYRIRKMFESVFPQKPIVKVISKDEASIEKNAKDLSGGMKKEVNRIVEAFSGKK